VPAREHSPEEAENKNASIHELRMLAIDLRSYATNAETVAAKGDPKAVERELRRMRRVLALWHGMRDANDLDLRMHFTQGVQFYARVLRIRTEKTEVKLTPEQRRKELARFSGQLVARISALAPAAGRRLKPSLVARAIERWSTLEAKKDWKVLVLAWGRNGNAETWRKQWEKRPKS
jgi:hypothetical protein